MSLSVTLLLVLVAFFVTVGAAVGRAPLWVAVLLLVVVHLVQLLPPR